VSSSDITVANISESFLPTRWRRKPAGIDMNRNYVTATLSDIDGICLLFASAVRASVRGREPRSHGADIEAAQGEGAGDSRGV